LGTAYRLQFFAVIISFSILSFRRTLVHDVYRQINKFKVVGSGAMPPCQPRDRRPCGEHVTCWNAQDASGRKLSAAVTLTLMRIQSTRNRYCYTTPSSQH